MPIQVNTLPVKPTTAEHGTLDFYEQEIKRANANELLRICKNAQAAQLMQEALSHWQAVPTDATEEIEAQINSEPVRSLVERAILTMLGREVPPGFEHRMAISLGEGAQLINFLKYREKGIRVWFERSR